LLKHSLERKEEELKFLAAIHGVKVKGKAKESAFMFRDPKEYEHMSMKERKEITEKMKKVHKGLSFGSF